jgi:uncharacterized glyoxalase superfamily protein PhnB
VWVKEDVTMSSQEVTGGSTVIPCLTYRDAPRAIAWLCDVFGFVRKAVHEDGSGGIAHAELTHGSGMIMLGSVRDTEYGRAIKEPRAVGGTTQSAYVVVADVDAVHARAVAAGAEMIVAIRDEDYGGRGFTCRDLEGHVWSFGSYH